ncbi:MAG: hypothetical protein HYT75_00485 [Deltaproteobacteria bacterium]|nr:hypothetical protein [Deltaproteobacteria bacterium]
MRYWFAEIFRELAKKDVRYVIVGGIAVNLLGVPRFTADLDLIVALEQKNILKFAKCMPKLGFKPKVPVISIGHLIRLKKQANRLQDISDIEALKKLSKELRSEKNGKKRG